MKGPPRSMEIQLLGFTTSLCHQHICIKFSRKYIIFFYLSI